MTLIEDLLDLDIPQNVRLSPDTQQVLYSTTLPLGHKTSENFCSILWLASTRKNGSSRKFTSGLFCDTTPGWSPNGDQIAFISDRWKQGESSAIYMLAPGAESEAYPVTPASNEQAIDTYVFSPDGEYIAYVSADEKSDEQRAREAAKDDPWVWDENWQFNRLRLVHLATRYITTFVNRDAHVTSSLAWNEDGSKIAFTEARTPDIESIDQYGTKISIVNVLTKQVEEICTFPKMMRDLIWVGDALYFIAGVDTDVLVTGDMVWRIDLTNVTSPAYHPYAHGEEDSVVALRKVGGQVVAALQHGMEDEVRILNGATLIRRKQQIATWDVAVRDDGGIIIAFSQEDTASPAEVFSVTAGAQMKPVQLSDHGGSIAQKKFGSARFLSCKSSDGKVDLEAPFVFPRGQTEDSDPPKQPVPTVVYIHGGPYDRITDQFNPTEMMWSAVLLSAGYAILSPNYRGSSGRGEAFAAAIHGAAGTVDYDDVITLTQHAIEQGFADKDRLIAMGWSQGGFMTFLCTVRNGLHGDTWKFKGTIAGAGISDGDTRAFTSDVGAYQDDLCRRPPWRCDKTDISSRGSSAIWEFKAAVEKGNVIPPVLILHGEKDQRVPLEQSIGFRRALMSAELPFQMVVYPREPHLFVERRHLVDLADRVLKFVDTHMSRPED